jgi:hypothetical protein
VVRTSGGKFVLQVNGVLFKPDVSVVYIGDAPCGKNKYPQRFFDPTTGTTTRINCFDHLKQLLPATITVRDSTTGQVTDNSLVCDF